MSFLYVTLVTEGALIIFFPDKKRQGALIGAGALNGANTVSVFGVRKEFSDVNTPKMSISASTVLNIECIQWIYNVLGHIVSN